LRLRVLLRNPVSNEFDAGDDVISFFFVDDDGFNKAMFLLSSSSTKLSIFFKEFCGDGDGENEELEITVERSDASFFGK
jgi:hypothetical protein